MKKKKEELIFFVGNEQETKDFIKREGGDFSKEKQLPTIKCPDCKKEITRDDLGYSQTGFMTYDVSFDEEGEPTYDENEFNADDAGEFYHNQCGITNLSAEQIKKLGIDF